MAKTEPTPASAPASRPLRRWAISLNVALQVVLALALLILVNYASYRHFARRDLSPSNDYSLSETTETYLRKLNKDVNVTVISTRDSDIMRDTRALVEEYRRVKRSRIKVQEIDPARDFERAEDLKTKHGITLHGNGVLVSVNDRTRFITEEELVIKGAGGSRDMPSIDYRGEDALTSAIIGLIEGETHKFYFITGKSSASGRNLDGDLTALDALARSQNIEIAALNLTDVTTIPADASGLIFIGPKYDLSDRELTMIQTYWEGKRAALLVMLDPNGERPRFRSFLAANGVAPRSDRVLFAESTSAGPRKEFSVQAGFLEASPISKPFADASTKLSGQTQSLDVLTDSPELRARSIVVTPLMDATDRYWGEVDYLAPVPVIDSADTKAPVHVAASVERGFVADERLRVDSSRMVVVGNANQLDPSARLAVDQDFISASLNWMINRERLIGITPKRKQIFRIQITDDQRRRVFNVTAILLPGAALALGMLVWAHRRA